MINIGETNIKQPKISLLFGIQQRLGKFGYIDFMIGPSYSIRENEIALFGEFAIGFAFNQILSDPQRPYQFAKLSIKE